MPVEEKITREWSLKQGGLPILGQRMVASRRYPEGFTSIVDHKWIWDYEEGFHVGRRFHTVIEEDHVSKPTRSIEKSMTDEEVQPFLQEWSLKWGKDDEAVLAGYDDGGCDFARKE